MGKKIVGKVVSVVIMLFFGFQYAANAASLSNSTILSADIPEAEVDPEKLEDFLDDYIPEQMESRHVPGLVITFVQGDKVVLSKGYGYADIEKGLPITPHTNLRAGSVSKPVFATAVIELIEQGLLDPDAPVSDYITDLDLADEFGPASTVGQLLTHMAGYPDKVVRSHAPDFEAWEPLGDVLHADLPPRVFPPGLVMAYSSWDYALLGYAVEKVTGLPYEEAVAELVLAPLGMGSSTFTQPLPPEIYNNLAMGYRYNYARNEYYIQPHDFVRMSPGVAFVTNGEDMSRYMLALLNGGWLDGNRIFEDEAMRMLLERQASVHPYSRGRSFAFAERTYSGRKSIYHDGNGIGFLNRLVLMPEQDLGFFMSINHRMFDEGMSFTEATVMIWELTNEIIENFVPETEAEIPQVHPMPDRADHIERFTGQYQSNLGIGRNDFFKIEALMDYVNVKDNGEGSLRIDSGDYEEVEPLVFQSVESPGSFVIFIENAAGEVEFLTYGGTGSYQKVPWYGSFIFTIILTGVIILVSLSMVIAWPLTRKEHWMIWVLSLLVFGFFVGVGMLFVRQITDLLRFYKEIPIGATILFALPWIIGLLTLSLPVFLLKTWKKGNITLWGKAYSVLVILSAAATVWIANFWNLM